MSAGVQYGQTPARGEVAYERLAHLYEISKLLMRFESAEQTIPGVVALIAQTLPLRSSILLLQDEIHGKPRAITWQGGAEGPDRLRPAQANAKRVYDYLVRSGVDFGTDASGAAVDPAEAAASKKRSIALPLAVGEGPIFGIFQLEGLVDFGELDLIFVNAVVNQVAVAVDRQAIIDARQAVVRRELAFARDVASNLAEGVIAVDLEQRITLINPAAAGLIGCAAEEVLGRRVEEVIDVRHADGTPITAEESPFGAAILRNEPVRSDELRFSTGERALVPVSFACGPLRRDGSVAGAVLTFRDISALELAEKEQRTLAEVSAILASSLEHRRTLSAVVRFAVPLLADLCFLDERHDDGTCHRIEVAFANEKKSRDFADKVRGFAPRAGWRTPQANVLESGKSLLLSKIVDPSSFAQDHEHAEIVRAIGLKSMLIVPLVARGRTLGALTFARTESDRRYSEIDLRLAEEIGHRAAIAIDNARLYELAQHATRLRDDLLAVVSHDLKNPLGAIILSVATIRQPPGAEDRARSDKHLRIIERAAERMERLIGDLLDTASIEAGRLSIELQRLEVAPLISEALDVVSSTAAAKSIRLEREVPRELPAVMADAPRLQQVLVNLLGNALKFSRDGGQVTVRAQRNGDAVMFSVTDTGTGIEERDRVHLFERFWQAPRTARLGSGLGLFIVKGIVEAHGGRVSVASTVGTGSTFSFSIPIAG